MRCSSISTSGSRTGPSLRPRAIPRSRERQLVPRDAVQFPEGPIVAVCHYMPGSGRWTTEPTTPRRKVITKEPPSLGAPFPVLVPQVNADGNDVGGIALPEVAVPLGTHTGWNVSTYPLSGLRYLAGLVGSFQPFAKTRAEREQSGDSRPSIEERYTNRQDYLQRVQARGNRPGARALRPRLRRRGARAASRSDLERHRRAVSQTTSARL